MGRCWKMVLVVVLAGTGVTANAQVRERYRPRGGGGDPAERTARQMQRAERLIQSFDSNRDGVIEPNEVRGQLRLVYERMAKEAGLNPTHSISVGELRAALGRYFKKLEEGVAKPSTPGKSSGGAKSRGEPSKKGKPASGKEPAPKVAGFGVQSEAPKVSGFGQAASGESATRPRSGHRGRSSGSSHSGSSSSAAQKKELLKIRSYAKSLLYKYDADKSGVLEEKEWKQIRNPPKPDRNGDGVVTVDELTAGLSEFSKRPSSSSISFSSRVSSRRSRSTSSHRSKSSRSDGQKSYRFLTPTERLPKGLPDWFARKDANGDGQVSMAEFHTSDWDEAKAAEFAGYDLNNDGMITPAECLEAAKTG